MVVSALNQLTVEQKALLSLRTGVSVRSVERTYRGEGGPHTTRLVEQVARRLRLPPPPPRVSAPTFEDPTRGES